MTRRTPKPRRPKMKRWVLYLDAESERNLRLRSKAHGVSRPVWVRSLINGRRPGAEAASMVAQADAWWDSRSPERRISLWRNHQANATAKVVTSSTAGQLSLEDALTAEGADA